MDTSQVQSKQTQGKRVSQLHRQPGEAPATKTIPTQAPTGTFYTSTLLGFVPFMVKDPKVLV